MNVAIYARVSSGAQDKAGTIETQIEVCRQYCELHAWDVVAEYIERPVSGTAALAERGQLMQAIAKAREQGYQRLVVFDWSRITRDHFRQLAALYGALEDAKLVVVEASTGTEHDIAAGGAASVVTALSTMLGHIDLQARNVRTQAGRRRAVEQGKRGAAGLPYALTWDEQTETYAWHEHRGQVVRDIYAAYLDDGRPADIARALNEAGEKSPAHYAAGGRHRDAPWARDSVWRVLQQTAYYGEWRRWKGTHLQILPALVSKETWLAVSAKRASRDSVKGPMPRGPKWLLDDLAVCGGCGSHLVHAGRWRKNKAGERVDYRYYRCSAKCGARGVRKDMADEQGWALLAQLLLEHWGHIEAHLVEDMRLRAQDDGTLQADIDQTKKLWHDARTKYRHARIIYDNGPAVPDEEKIREAKAVNKLRMRGYAAKAEHEAAVLALQEFIEPEDVVPEAVRWLREELARGLEVTAEEQRVIAVSLLEWIDAIFVIGKPVQLDVRGFRSARTPSTMAPRSRGNFLVLEYQEKVA